MRLTGRHDRGTGRVSFSCQPSLPRSPSPSPSIQGSRERFERERRREGDSSSGGGCIGSREEIWVKERKKGRKGREGEEEREEGGDGGFIEGRKRNIG